MDEGAFPIGNAPFNEFVDFLDSLAVLVKQKLIIRFSPGKRQVLHPLVHKKVLDFMPGAIDDPRYLVIHYEFQILGDW